MAVIRHRRLVLVADDDAAARAVTAEALSSRGHDVETAGDGWEAVAISLRRRSDALVLDLEMPRLDGLGVARRVRTAGVPTRIVIVSSAGGPEVREAVHAAGIEFLAKPVDLGLLEAWIDRDSTEGGDAR